jgi:hypothetical protein
MASNFNQSINPIDAPSNKATAYAEPDTSTANFIRSLDPALKEASNIAGQGALIKFKNAIAGSDYTGTTQADYEAQQNAVLHNILQAATDNDGAALEDYTNKLNSIQTAARQGVVSATNAAVRQEALLKQYVNLFPHLETALRSGASATRAYNELTKQTTMIADPQAEATKKLLEDAAASGINPAILIKQRQFKAIADQTNAEIAIGKNTLVPNAAQMLAKMTYPDPSEYEFLDFSKGLPSDPAARHSIMSSSILGYMRISMEEYAGMHSMLKTIPQSDGTSATVVDIGKVNGEEFAAYLATKKQQYVDSAVYATLTKLNPDGSQGRVSLEDINGLKKQVGDAFDNYAQTFKQYDQLKDMKRMSDLAATAEQLKDNEFLDAIGNYSPSVAWLIRRSGDVPTLIKGISNAAKDARALMAQGKLGLMLSSIATTRNSGDEMSASLSELGIAIAQGKIKVGNLIKNVVTLAQDPNATVPTSNLTTPEGQRIDAALLQGNLEVSQYLHPEDNPNNAVGQRIMTSASNASATTTSLGALRRFTYENPVFAKQVKDARNATYFDNLINSDSNSAVEAISPDKIGSVSFNPVLASDRSQNKTTPWKLAEYQGNADVAGPFSTTTYAGLSALRKDPGFQTSDTPLTIPNTPEEDAVNTLNMAFHVKEMKDGYVAAVQWGKSVMNLLNKKAPDTATSTASTASAAPTTQTTNTKPVGGMSLITSKDTPNMWPDGGPKDMTDTLNAIGQIESGGKNVKAKSGSASSPYQITFATFKSVYEKINPTFDALEEQAKRHVFDTAPEKVFRQVAEYLTKDNQRILEKAGVTVNFFNTYNAHLGSAEWAVALAKASPDTNIRDLLLKVHDGNEARVNEITDVRKNGNIFNPKFTKAEFVTNLHNHMVQQLQQPDPATVRWKQSHNK